MRILPRRDQSVLVDEVAMF